jgi:hypothetical protein
MNIEDALPEFQRYVEERASTIATMTPEEATAAMLGFTATSEPATAI